MDKPKGKKINVLIAEDDGDDFFLIRKAMEDHCPDVNLTWVKDGEELMDYLRQGPGEGESDLSHPVPAAVILDLNMPRKDGRQALEEMKQAPALCTLPVIVFTTSNSREDMSRVYRLGATSYNVKPANYSGVVSFVKAFRNWLELAGLSPGS